MHRQDTARNLLTFRQQVAVAVHALIDARERLTVPFDAEHAAEEGHLERAGGCLPAEREAVGPG
ncbi:hypothetical protein OG871_35840 [Kitasatospora sp. NBC_00374]|uniref:hypothetical protein n=1 Tax=Kitasatospora sp. NBC_00374 TaxID=2975964 RepID=UPI003255EA4F